METAYSWGSKRHRAKLQHLAKDSEILHAIQGVAATGIPLSLAMLGVLVIDGSESSCDALVIHISEALRLRDSGLETFAMLRKYARKTPVLDSLFEEVECTLKERNEESPALALGPLIGVRPSKRFWFRVNITSRQNNRDGVPRIQGSIEIDSRISDWFFVTVIEVVPDAKRRITTFSHDRVATDELELGQCRPEDLPAWLTKAEQKLQINWRKFSPESNVRGENLARIAIWLAGDAEKVSRASH